jgi:C-terminal processing protease CtpA/Prc
VLQLFTVFKSGGGIEMATAHLLTTSGLDLSKGIEPDLPISSAEASNDGAVKLALSRLGA